MSLGVDDRSPSAAEASEMMEGCREWHGLTRTPEMQGRNRQGTCVCERTHVALRLTKNQSPGFRLTLRISRKKVAKRAVSGDLLGFLYRNNVTSVAPYCFSVQGILFFKRIFVLNKQK